MKRPHLPNLYKKQPFDLIQVNFNPFYRWCYLIYLEIIKRNFLAQWAKTHNYWKHCHFNESSIVISTMSFHWASSHGVNLVYTSRKHSSVNIHHKGGVLRYSLPSHDKACSLLAVAMTTRIFSKPMRVLYFCRPKTSASRGGSACLIIDPCFYLLNRESGSVQSDSEYWDWRP